MERYGQVKGKRKADVVPKEGPATGPKKQRFEVNHLNIPKVDKKETVTKN